MFFFDVTGKNLMIYDIKFGNEVSIVINRVELWNWLNGEGKANTKHSNNVS